MFDNKLMKAIGAIIAKQARSVAAENHEAANDIIDLAPLLKPWAEGKWEKNDVCTHDGLPYWCMQAHDSTRNPTWSPAYDTALFALYHGRDALHAMPFKAEGHNPYNKGHWMIWTDGYRYCSNTDGNVHTPISYPISWDGPFDENGDPV